MKTLRVFVSRTSQTPIDEYTTIGFPSLFLPKDVGEVHISTIFSWDIEKALRLKRNYELYYPKVLVGGPAFAGGNYDPQFTPGMYVKKGITITTRGCNFKCPFCLVDKKEGKFQEINIEPGNIIQDNNILLASKEHLRKVFDMLKTQKGIRFVGGLDKRLLTDWHIEELRSLHIKELWLAFDSWDNKKEFVRVIEKLKMAGFNRNKIRCYVLAGFNEPIQAGEERLRFVYNCGALPFVQKYRDENDNQISKEDKSFIRRWSRPAIMKSIN
uniref:Putative radical SAM superfamily protein n=1 Tax=viral metagenome TaxID=1070528 RepID=A0A6M3KCA9_9ZZZZ